MSAILNQTLSPLVIGVVLGAGLWGISCGQVMNYYSNRPKDHLIIKLTVFFMFIFDTAHQATVTQLMYLYVVTNWGNVEGLTAMPTATLMAQSVSALLAQILVLGFYIARIYRLSENNKSRWLFTVPVTTLAVAEVGLTIAEIWKFSARSKDLVAFFANTRRTTPAGFGVSFTCDVFITLSMIYLIHTSRTAFARTNTLIDRLISFTLSTNALTSLVYLFVVITSCLYPTTMIWFPLYYCGVRLEVNSVMAALNMRPYLAGRRGVMDQTSVSGVALSNLDRHSRPTNTPITMTKSGASHSTNRTMMADQLSDVDLETKAPDVV